MESWLACKIYKTNLYYMVVFLRWREMYQRWKRADMQVMVLCITIVALGLQFLPFSTANSLVAPGGVTPYTGGGGQRQRGFGYVRDPAHGFFVAGSTLQGLNGKRIAIDTRKRWAAPLTKLLHTGRFDRSL